MVFLCQTGHRRAFAGISSVPKRYAVFARLMLLNSDGRSSFGYVVAHQFEVTWRHPTTCPPVSKIYQIIGDASSVDAYTAYKCVHHGPYYIESPVTWNNGRQALEDVGDFQSQNLAEGNEERRWHG